MFPSFVQRFWSELEQAFRPRRKPAARVRRAIPPVQPLEIRALLAGEFSNNQQLDMPALGDSNAVWGDMDNDGDLDVAIIGQDSNGNDVSRIYRNDSTLAFTTFVDIGAGLQGVRSGDVAWGDFNNDGLLDLAMTGLSGQSLNTQRVSKIYRNTGSGFVDQNAGLTGMGYSSVVWGDTDNDGDLDLVITGLTGTNSRTMKHYRNQAGTFVEDANSGMFGVEAGDLAFGDYDLDGDLDLLVTGGVTDTNGISFIYKNNQINPTGGTLNSFSQTDVGLVSVRDSSAEWGDYDNDGDLDIAIAGRDPSGVRQARIYRNDGNNTFTDINAGLLPVDAAALAWGDFDNDGDLDLLLNGQGNSTRLAEVFRNNGNSTFTNIGPGFGGVFSGSAVWGDFDGDRDLDVLQTGFVGGAPSTSLFRNQVNSAGTAPGSPPGLTATALSTTSLKFTWTAPADSQTPTAGLSYNLRVGTTPGDDDVFSTMADIDDNAANGANGFRRLAQRGAIQGTSYTLNNLVPGQTYFWSVQAVDTTLMGSVFASEVNTLFTDTGISNLPLTTSASQVWGDYDQDGDLDLLALGTSTDLRTRLFRNDGGAFTEISAGITGLSSGSAAWGDSDRDGDLDFVITGSDSNNVLQTYLYRNDGNNTFSQLNAGFPGVRVSSVAWGDADNDGDLDLALAGITATTRIARLYRNTGNNTFVDANAGLTGTTPGSNGMAWADSDSDGDLDLITTGNTDNGFKTILYQNDGSGGLTALTTNLPNIVIGGVDWGDYDQDGRLDLALTGRDANLAFVTKIYHNDGNNSFTEVANPTGVAFSAVKWGDADGDGDLDLLVAGVEASNVARTKLYLNLGNSVFIDSNAGLPGVYSGGATWGDFDNDGRLDLQLFGISSGSTRISRVFVNQSSLVNTAPNAPTNLTATPASSTAVTFSWTAATDNETASAGLSYNLRVGTTPGGSDVFTTMSDTDANAANGPNGYRRVAQRGAIQGTSFTLQGLDPTKEYYWSVQAVDAGLMGSPFAAEKTAATGTFAEIGGLGLAGVAYSSVAWGDSDNDGDLDILLTGRDATFTPIAKVYRNDGNSTFTDVNAALTGVVAGSVAWGDSDNDGDLDILLTGLDATITPIAKVYRNDGNNTFTDVNAGLTGVYFSSVAWGDSDNDGDLDILLTGRDATITPIAKVYRNDGNNTFTDGNARLTGVDRGSVAWGDSDNDGDLDILLTGISVSGDIAKVYRNDGNNAFSNVDAGLTGVRYSSVAWGDSDNDGDLDILLTGLNNNTDIAKVYRNDANNTFHEVNAGLSGASFGSVAWGDSDNDGDLDILLAGLNNDMEIVKVYRNDSTNVFNEIDAGLTGGRNSSVAWGDSDNDGDLDILLTGRIGTGAPTTKVYRNNVTEARSTQFLVRDLTATVSSATSITFNWFADSDGPTPTEGFSYNLRVGTTPGGSDVFSTMSDTDANAANGPNGYRRVAQRGAIQGTSFTLQNLTFGRTYYWSVQAVDATLTGSDFAAEQSVVLNNAPTISGLPANQSVNDNATLTPLANVVITDPNSQAMNARVTIVNGVVRGDFTAAATAGWTRNVVGNDIRYERSFSATANIGAAVQAAIRPFVFVPRSNAIKPNTTELTDISLLVSDGLASATATTRLTTTSINDAPLIGGVSNTVTVNDNATVNPLSSLTVTDLDRQELLISVTILNGRVRGDFTPASVAGWMRSTLGNDITYKLYFNPQLNVGAAAQAALRALVFVPRQNAIKPRTTELTDFQVTVSDGVAPAIANRGTRLTTTSVNDAPILGGVSNSVVVNDNASVLPFATVTVTDPDLQEMLISVTILNGVVRGDFTNATPANGWSVRRVIGNNITYERYFNPVTNVGVTAQAAFRALIFRPRANAIKPGTSELTDFQLTISDGVAPAVVNSMTRVRTDSVNDAPVIVGTAANQTMNDNETKAVFSSLTVTDPDTQDLFVQVTITSGTTRGDFTAASTAGWTRRLSGTNILYERFFPSAANNAAVVQAAIRALVFQPRTNVPVGTTETTSFTVTVNDGLASATNSLASVITTGVTPRAAERNSDLPALFGHDDITTVVLAGSKETRTGRLASRLKRL